MKELSFLKSIAPLASGTHDFAILHDPGLVLGLDCYIYVLRGHLKLVLPTPRTFYK